MGFCVISQTRRDNLKGALHPQRKKWLQQAGQSVSEELFVVR